MFMQFAKVRFVIVVIHVTVETTLLGMQPLMFRINKEYNPL